MILSPIFDPRCLNQIESNFVMNHQYVFQPYDEIIGGETYLIIPMEYKISNVGEIIFLEKMISQSIGEPNYRTEKVMIGDEKYEYYKHIINEHQKSFYEKINKKEEVNMIQKNESTFKLEEIDPGCIWLLPKDAADTVYKNMPSLYHKHLYEENKTITMFAFMESLKIIDYVTYVIISFKSANSDEIKNIVCESDHLSINENQDVIISNSDGEKIIKICSENLKYFGAIYIDLFDERYPSRYDDFGYFKINKLTPDDYSYILELDCSDNEHIGLNLNYIVQSSVKAVCDLDDEKINFSFEALVQNEKFSFYIGCIHINSSGFTIEHFGNSQIKDAIFSKMTEFLTEEINTIKAKLYNYITDYSSIDVDDQPYDIFESLEISKCK